MVALVVLGAVAAALLLPGRGAAELRTLVEPLERGAFVREVTGTGVVIAEQERHLSFRGAGTVLEVPVTVGDEVVAGTLLARLDTASLERDIASIRASLASARADQTRIDAQRAVDTLDARSAVAAAEDQRERAATALTRAQDDLRIARELFGVGAASADEVRAADTAVASAERTLAQADITLDTAVARQDNLTQLAEAQRSGAQAQVAQLATQLGNAESRLADAELVAPFDGVVTALAIEAGDAVGQQSAVTVADVTSLHVEARFDENRAAELTLGQPATIVPDADASRTLAARVTRLSPIAGRETGAAQVVAELGFVTEQAAPETTAWLRPGYTVTVRVRVRELADALLMPLEAITEGADGAYVHRVVPTGEDRGTVERVPVTVLERNPTVAAVDGELRDGDLIAVIDLDTLRDGAGVTFPPVE
ncbi:MAG: efflux RND transporter periplasmic adaptor subunit [Trueperaceae bacterium]